MSRTIICMAALAVSAVPAAHAQWETSGHFGVTSDYVHRGISRSDEDPAVQGGFDFKHDSGGYLGFWGSSVDFDDGDEASIETDFYGGYRDRTDNGLGYDIGAIYYAFPGADDNLDYNYFEIYGKLNYQFDPVTLTGGVFYSPEYFRDSGDGEYFFLGADLPIRNGSFIARIGRQRIDEGEDYTEWKIGAAGRFAGFTAEIAYHDTNVDHNTLADERIVVSINRAF